MAATNVAQRAGGYSAYSADWWAYGVCLYMWLYHCLPHEAPTAALAMQRIREGGICFPDLCVGCPGAGDEVSG